jgi:hypothetical protein
MIAAGAAPPHPAHAPGASATGFGRKAPMRRRGTVMIRTAAVLLLGLAPLEAGFAAAPDHATRIEAMVAGGLRAEIASPVVIEALKARNAANAGVDQAAIDALDVKWRAEVEAGGGPMVAETLASPTSEALRKIQAAHAGLLTELFVMDNLGLVVGESDPTSDYWQGDEAKWSRTYPVGPDALFVDEVEFDDSTQTMQAQASFTIADPATGAAIGAVTVGFNVDMLMR